MNHSYVGFYLSTFGSMVELKLLKVWDKNIPEVLSLTFLWERLLISRLILSEFKQINLLLIPLKSSQNLDDFRGNRS